jgi:L-aminopeptidase/D-esterase-like protein
MTSTPSSSLSFWQTIRSSSIATMPLVRVGHITHKTQGTGCSVILFENDVVCGVDCRGGAPASHEIQLLDPNNLVNHIQAIVLTGGSAIGLRCVEGVVRYLLEKNRGFPTHAGVVPIVPAAAIFDLASGETNKTNSIPSADDGYAACLNAEQATDKDTHSGNIGAGSGAVIGKLAGYDHAMRGGMGSVSFTCDDGLQVGVLIVVNALGDIYNPWNGNIVAGARTSDNQPLETSRQLREKGMSDIRFGNTTLAVVTTNAKLSKTEATQVARMAQAGICKTISPSHTPYDGDTVFAVSTGEHQTDLIRVGSIAADLVAAAILDSVLAADALKTMPSASSINWPAVNALRA